MLRAGEHDAQHPREPLRSCRDRRRDDARAFADVEAIETAADALHVVRANGRRGDLGKGANACGNVGEWVTHSGG